MHRFKDYGIFARDFGKKPATRALIIRVRDVDLELNLLLNDYDSDYARILGSFNRCQSGQATARMEIMYPSATLIIYRNNFLLSVSHFVLSIYVRSL